MDVKKRPLRFLMTIISLLVLACGSRSSYVGTYQTEDPGDGITSSLELKDHGEGYWRLGDNEEIVSWHPKHNQIRLNTRKGGVIVAAVNGDALEITIAGGKKLIFRKISKS